MGNGALLWWLCVGPAGQGRREARLVLWRGETRAAEPGRTAGEVMLEFGAGGRVSVVCRADGFRLGRPAPVLDIEDRLEAGRTYLVLPADRLPQGQGRDGAIVTAASLAALSYDKAGGDGSVSSSSSKSPFEYVKDGDGRTVISVTQEFIVKTVTARRRPSGGGGGGRGDEEGNVDGRGALCSTPELRKHYEQLVRAARGRPWSPRLDTIKERNGRRVADVVSPRMLSPARLLELDKEVIWAHKTTSVQIKK